MKVNYLGSEFEVLNPGTIIVNKYSNKEYIIKGCDKQYRKYIVENDGKEGWVSRTEVAEPNNRYPKLAAFIIK